MYHIEFQITLKKKAEWQKTSQCLAPCQPHFSPAGLITSTIYIPLSQQHSSHFQFLAGQNAVYFYLRSFLSSSEKAKWAVVDSFFTTSISKIVLAAYREEWWWCRGNKRQSDSPRSRCKGAVSWAMVRSSASPRPASFTIYLCVCIYVWPYCLC